jgi:hypothetical protein
VRTGIWREVVVVVVVVVVVCVCVCVRAGGRGGRGACGDGTYITGGGARFSRMHITPVA